ncbi:mucin-5AC-like [Macadamia integrifolia]|uniref:mucin-5AC-like n=1 Tax=Macadamia integrifolia TaxID=60698 RepID=UPI001C52E78C|nr:mucin-5AC-like [Macadamia integrifolia]
MNVHIKLSFGSSLVLLVEVAVALAALLQCATAKTTHVVGDSLGWTLTSDGPITYSNWASSQTFTVGDVMVFNFITGIHDVAEVSKASFDACDSIQTIGFVINKGPARIILRSTGEHYFICTVIGHCSFGQKLAINVTAASRHANPPTDSPPPSKSPMSATRPALSIAPEPANSPAVLTPSPAYVSLSPMSPAPTLSEAPGPAANPLAGMASPPSMNLSPTLAPTLSRAPGPGPGPANPVARVASPTSVVSQSSMLAPVALARVPATYLVGDSLGWTIPLGGSITYATWANGKTFFVGDTLCFYFQSGQHDVVEVPKGGYDACDSSTTIGPILNTGGPARITLKSPGEHFFICSYPAHCSFGQKLAINVTAMTTAAMPPTMKASPPSISPSIATPPTFATSPSTTPLPSTLPTSGPSPLSVSTPPTLGPSPSITPSPSSSTSPVTSPTSAASPPPFTTPSPALAPSHSRAPETYTVGDSLGWVLPIGGPSVYTNWASHRTFAVGDTLLFNFVTGQHDVAEVTKSSFDECNSKATIIGSHISTGPAKITLNSLGEHYLICTFQGHCQVGQKLAVNVTLTRDTYSPSSNPASIAISPSMLAHAPSEHSKKSSSASSLTIAGFFVTSLTAGNALVHNCLIIFPKEVISKAQSSFTDYVQACVIVRQSSQPPPSSDHYCWSRPHSGFVKINTDAAVLKRHNKAGISFVARDSNGEVLAAISDPIPFTSPLVAKVIALQ